MTRVAILINTLAFGGAEKQAVLLSNLLSSDYSVTLIILDHQLIEKRLLDLLNNEKVNFIKIKHGSWFSKLKQIYTILKREQSDVLFTSLAQSNVIGIVAGKLAKTNKIYSGIRSNRVPKKKKIIQRFIHNYFNTGTIFNNFSGSDKMQNDGFKAEKCIVIPNGISVPRKLNTERLKNTDKVVIISLGRFLPVKNFSDAILVISKLIKSNPKVDITYKLGGYGPEEEMLRAKAKELKIEKNIEFVINPSNIESFFQSGDIFFSNSLNEGTPNAVMEAMTFGLPIVGTNAGDTRFLVKHNENGFVSESDNLEDITNNLSKLVNDSVLRHQMGERSFRIISNEYSLEILKKRYTELIEN